MKFALDNNNKIEATKGAKGVCRSCGSELIAKCGEVNVNHWSHKGRRTCDPWWENETEWHRSWKNKFPIDWQEVIHFDDNGEKHIADVKTKSEWVLEFQHSYLDPEERRARNVFYPKLVWVVDGLRRKRDLLQFKNVLEESISENGAPYICRVQYPEEYRLLKEWHNDRSPVLFDFQESKELRQPVLWLLLPKISNCGAYLTPFSRSEFIEIHNNNEFDEVLRKLISLNRNILISNKQINQSNRFIRVERSMVNSRKRRRRF